MTTPMMQSVDDSSHFIEGAVSEVTRRSMEGLEPQVRRVFSDVDPNFTVLDIRTMQEQVDAGSRPAARGRSADRPVRHPGA